MSSVADTDIATADTDIQFANIDISVFVSVKYCQAQPQFQLQLAEIAVFSFSPSHPPR
jgi:hypothetical protein